MAMGVVGLSGLGMWLLLRCLCALRLFDESRVDLVARGSIAGIVDRSKSSCRSSSRSVRRPCQHSRAAPTGPATRAVRAVEFDDAGYRSASDEINTGLVRTSAERKDIEAITTYLVRLDPTTPIAISPHQETATPQSQPVATQAQTTTVQATTREPALVLHVKEK